MSQIYRTKRCFRNWRDFAMPGDPGMAWGQKNGGSPPSHASAPIRADVRIRRRHTQSAGHGITTAGHGNDSGQGAKQATANDGTTGRRCREEATAIRRGHGTTGGGTARNQAHGTTGAGREDTRHWNRLEEHESTPRNDRGSGTSGHGTWDHGAEGHGAVAVTERDGRAGQGPAGGRGNSVARQEPETSVLRAAGTPASVPTARSGPSIEMACTLSMEYTAGVRL